MTGSSRLAILDDRPDRLHVALNRPEVRNAIDRAMVDELTGVCDDLERAPRILLLSGAGGVFASGADITELRARRRHDALAGINSRLFSRIAALPMPVIAAVDGYALGGGAELAYAADFRLASTTAKIGNPETGLGIAAAAGATWRLPALVGETVAKEILLTGRILSAAEALSAGLVGSVHEPDALLAAAHALADRIAQQGALAVQLTKTLLRLPLAAHPTADDAAQAVLFETEEKERRMTAFLERKRR